jgi:uncharacterized protein
MTNRPMAPHSGAVMCIAKTPQPGRSKTRLCPPLSPQEASEVAWASLLDSLDAVAAVPAARHVLVLDGDEGPWIPPCFEVIPQRGLGLAERLAAAFTDVDADAVVIAMDTPQVTGDMLASALAVLDRGDSVFGPAADGGYWLIGLRRHVSPIAVFHDIPMSQATTGASQLARLDSLGLRTHHLDTLRDIDVFDDLHAVAASCEGTRLAALVASLTERLQVG